MVFVTPRGAEVSVAPTDGAVTFEDTFTPGHYTTRSEDGPPTVFSVEVDPVESETAALPLEEDPAEMVEGRVAVNVPQWRWLVWLALALLGLEAVLRWRARPNDTP